MKTRKRSKWIRLDEVEKCAVEGDAQVLIHLQQNSCRSGPKPWRRNRIHQKCYQGAVGADANGQDVFVEVVRTVLPQQEGHDCWSYEMQRIKKSRKIIQKRGPVKLLKHKSRDRTEDSQLKVHRLRNMHNPFKAANQSIHGFIAHEQAHKRNPVFYETATPLMVSSVYEETYRYPLRRWKNSIFYTEST